MDLEARLAELEKKIAELENEITSNVKRVERDLWDRITQAAPLLITVAIAAGGWIVTDMMKQIDIANSERQAVQQESTARMSARVAQAQLISSFLNPLLSAEPSEQKLAIQALLIALPEDGPDLIRTLAATSVLTEVQSFAEQSLDDRREDLVQGLFADDNDVSVASMNELAGGWTRDAQLVPELLAITGQNLANRPGVVNALGVLSSMDNDLLRANRQEVEQLLNGVSASNPDAKKLADQILVKMESA